jgi:thiamine-phosphate pyrophosphorylase
MRLVLPRLYVILDAALLTIPETVFAQMMSDVGVRLLQYRNKAASSHELLEKSAELASVLGGTGITFLVNDRPDVARMSKAGGVHVGQQDMSVEQARAVVGPAKLVGVSTHNLLQFEAASASSADYIAVGPIFSTHTKANTDPVVGTEFLKKARRMTAKPIVAIGGIKLENAAAVIEAGADSVAVISDILQAADPGRRARRYLNLLSGAISAPESGGD